MMKMKNKLIAAMLISAALMLSGCGGTEKAPSVSEAAETTTTTEATTTAAETTEAEINTETEAASNDVSTSEITSAEAQADENDGMKGVNPVRTAEELEGKKVIALTFDDGPNTAVTNEIIDLLEEYGIKASFFVIGQNITPETGLVMQRAHAQGHEINSHSYTHSYMDQMTAEDIKDEMKKTSDLIYEYTGEYPHFFRPPYIAVNDTMYENIDLPFISGLGCNDWDDGTSVEKRVKFLTKRCPEGCIILLHDQETNEKTVEALRQSLPVMLEDGFEFVTVSELFVAKGITPVSESGKIYSYGTESGWAQ